MFTDVLHVHGTEDKYILAKSFQKAVVLMPIVNF